MANLACKYPNFAAEMTRNQFDYGPLYEEIAVEFGKSRDMVSNWFTGRAGELPTKVAFTVRDRYFPTMSVDYLFSETPTIPNSTNGAF